jgi:hypothetical protein
LDVPERWTSLKTALPHWLVTGADTGVLNEM